jgi:hypothetical protein
MLLLELFQVYSMVCNIIKRSFLVVYIIDHDCGEEVMQLDQFL